MLSEKTVEKRNKNGKNNRQADKCKVEASVVRHAFVAAPKIILSSNLSTDFLPLFTANWHTAANENETIDYLSNSQQMSLLSDINVIIEKKKFS